MDIFEMAAKLVEKTGVTFEEAKKALEENGGDMLDAVIALERAGKIQKKAAYYSSSDDQTEEEAEVLRGDVFNADGTKAKTSTTREQAGRFWESVKRFVKTLTSATFQVERKGEELIAVPVLVLILALIFGFHLMVVLLIGGLFFGCHYHFLGVDKVTVDVNEMSKRASQFAQDIKDDLQQKKDEK